ncbi:alpha/beta-hydrolase family protein [Pelagibacterium sp. H642]|uniref:alpha/beta hydrolase n=1 Tax=Pelagibacterium sp. H642 TaxID=1881069 RepID=UPI0028159CB4|nr:alpha/beta-hydrolase family protein [Pelagibacterium sp. H642]WMT90677.1 alpha/beta-hydrolase family protein [Pelagibacterium sp. H642]
MTDTESRPETHRSSAGHRVWRSVRTIGQRAHEMGWTSTGGLFVGLVFFALSLTPSLIPRHYVLQGILSGCVFAAGYAVGLFIEWLLDYLGLVARNKPWSKWVRIGLLGAAGLLALAFLWISTDWQNSIRIGMGMAPVENHQPVRIALIALLPALILVGLGTLIVRAVQTVSHWLARIVPPRVALIGGIIIVAVLSSTIVDGVLVRWILAAADRTYAEFDQLAGSQEPPPADPLRSGSAASLIAWDTIGRDARAYVQSGPTREEIEAMIGRPAETPLRVYVGLRSAETVADRARLALAEMQRVGAFEKSVLVLIMPVGTGWVDPAAIDTLEFLHGGDVASVALQYSYLTSWLSLVTEPDVGVAAAQALFNVVYEHWTSLPEDERPKLYLHGLSLGAYSSQASASLYDILGDPFDGALWVGPPFASITWRNLTENRDPDSPWWLPNYGEGATVRFASQGEVLQAAGPDWGPTRILYLQYPSDPIVFFEPAMLYRPPEWLSGERPPGISTLLNWYPVVTFFQLLLDMALAQTSPIGFGHVYAPTDYLDAWLVLTESPGWTQAEFMDLREKLTRHGERMAIDPGWFRQQAK